VRKLAKIAIIAILMITAASWLTSVAYGQNNDTLQLNAENGQDIQITPALPEDAPAATFYGNAIGSVAAGDLFYINAANATPDITVNLYLTNVDQLVHNLRYLNLEVGVFREVSPDQWEKALLPDGSAFPIQYLTMNNGTVTFVLPGTANYKVTIEAGCFKSHPAAGQETAAPAFYLEAAYQ
jgi:hypothetical protein